MAEVELDIERAVRIEVGPPCPVARALAQAVAEGQGVEADVGPVADRRGGGRVPAGVVTRRLWAVLSARLCGVST
jgi:hypothetical protein